MVYTHVRNHTPFLWLSVNNEIGFARRAGKWQDVRLDFRDFSMTYKGHAIHQPVHAVLGIPRHNILAIGITMAASEEMPDEGDFKLEVESVIAGAYK